MPKIELERMTETVEVFLEGEKIAETTNAIRLLEPGQAPEIYIPKNDLMNIDLVKCDDYDSPRKGHAELYTIKHAGHRLDNAAWSYDRPITHLKELMGRVAFYPERVQEIRVRNLQ